MRFVFSIVRERLSERHVYDNNMHGPHMKKQATVMKTNLLLTLYSIPEHRSSLREDRLVADTVFPTYLLQVVVERLYDNVYEILVLIRLCAFMFLAC
jgi:hypothetical protein